MPPPRKPTEPTASAVDAFCTQFDHLFNRHAARTAFRQYLIGFLLPREHHKALTGLASLVPGSKRQSLHHFLHDAPWEVAALNKQRLALWQAHPTLASHAAGVLIMDETGDRKRGHGLELAANQYLGKLGHTANGVVWSDQPVERGHPAGAAGQEGLPLPDEAGAGLGAGGGARGAGHPFPTGGGGFPLRRPPPPGTPAGGG